VERRLQFIINEARQEYPIYDQTVRYAFRVVTNFYSIGKDGGSSAVYKGARYRSQAAHDLIRSGNWKGKLLNEHQEPLKAVWDWICAEKGSVTATQIEERLKRWPMVVLTREENNALDSNEVDPIARYKNILVLYRRDNGEWIPRSL